MSIAPRPDPEHAWQFAQRLLGEDELDRLDALSDEEKLAELHAEGHDASWAPSAESLLAGIEGIEASSRFPVPPSSAGARVVPLARRRKVSPLLWVAAASLVALGALAAAERSAIVAKHERNQPPPIQPLPTEEPPVPRAPAAPPTPQELATKLLDEADEACDGNHFGLCTDKIEEAVKLGPGADEAERIKRLRKYIYDEHTNFHPDLGKMKRHY